MRVDIKKNQNARQKEKLKHKSPGGLLVFPLINILSTGSGQTYAALTMHSTGQTEAHCGES
jgi:hypothetical protein